jgi:hypothetical protein
MTLRALTKSTFVCLGATALTLVCCGQSGPPEGNAPADTDTSDAVAPAAPNAPAAPAALVTVGPNNPAATLGVQTFEVRSTFTTGAPLTGPTALRARALDASGAALFDVLLEVRSDRLIAWAERTGQAQGASAPTAADLVSFFGAAEARDATGAAPAVEVQGRLVAGLIVAELTSGASTLTAGRGGGGAVRLTAGSTPAPFCPTPEEAAGNVSALQGAMLLCVVEAASAAILAGSGGVLAAAIPFVIASIESLSGGLGCTSLYGLLCDQVQIMYRSECCFKDPNVDFRAFRQRYSTLCFLGDPVPDPAECAPHRYCVDYRTSLVGTDPPQCGGATGRPFELSDTIGLGFFSEPPTVTAGTFGGSGASCVGCSPGPGRVWAGGPSVATGRLGFEERRVVISRPDQPGGPNDPINFTVNDCGSQTQTVTFGTPFVCD